MDEKDRIEKKTAPTQHRLVTVLCAELPDLPGSPQDWHSREIRKWGGMPGAGVEGRVTGLWGSETPRGDDPERALRAALALKGMVQEARARSGDSAPALFRIGVDTGPVRVRPAAAAAGEAMETAARLLARARPDEIVVSENTYRHVRGVFDVTLQEPLPAEGKPARLPVYRVDRAKPRAFRIPIRGVGDVETSTVGREHEQKILQECYRGSFELGRTHVALVTGEAGVGKSRLLYEFHKWLELRPELIRLFESQAVPETARRPNGTFRDLFSFRFQIRESDGAEKVREKFREGLSKYLDKDRADVLGHWLGFDFSQSPSVTGLLGSRSFRQQAQADLLHVFRSMAETPTVLFLEDVHWADDTSLDLIETLVAAVPDRPLLFICLARPTFLERRKAWGADRQSFTRLELAPLTEAQSWTLVDEILQKADDVPEEIGRLVVKGARGNPFYVEELILLLIDRGVILTGGERWRIDREKLAGVSLPRTLKGVLRARLDCLPSKERLLLQCASVVGRQFWDGAVRELSAEPGEKPAAAPAGAAHILEIARERQLIFQTASSFEGAQEYQFKHAILRDIVYDTVLHKMRRAYHSGVARWLERNIEDRESEYLLVLAQHCEAAEENEKAAAYLLRAAQVMAKVSAYKDAVNAFRRADELLPAGETRIREVVFTELGDAYRVLGDYLTAKHFLSCSLELSRKTGSARNEMLALNAMARTEIIQGDYAEAKSHLAEALLLASRQDYQDGAAQVLLNLADVSFRLGDADTAMSSGLQSLRISTDLKDAQGIAGAHRVLGFASMMQGDYREAAHHHDQGLEIFRTVGDRWGVATCLINLGEVHRKMGKIDEAVAFWRKSLPIAQEIGARLSVAIAYVNMGGALAGRLGSEEQALVNLKRALKESMAIDAIPIALEGLVSVAILYAREGRQPVAARLLGTVTNHPSFNAEIQDYSDPLMNQLRKKLGEETLRSLLDQGRGAGIKEVVDEVTRETAPSDTL